ncbi:MAG: AMP-binding protein [Roseinatronobacter sp.]|nr:AMP-binding protein [Roseinatronobacter sp.]
MFNAEQLVSSDANFRPLTPLDLLDRTLEFYSARGGVIWGAQAWSYQEFGQIVARMAGFLRGQGIGPGDVVSVMLPNRPEMIAAHFAIPALGAVINTLNTRLDAPEIAYILRHADSRLVLAAPELQERLAGCDIPVFGLCSAPGAGDGLDLFSGDVPALDMGKRIADEMQPISLNYTSGTTGRPKGVVYNHRGAYLNALGSVLALGVTEKSRYLWTLPMFHCNGWSHAWAVTAAGATHICLDRVEPGLITAAIESHAVTHMSCAPVVLYMLLEHVTKPTPVRVRITTGGAAPTPALLAGLSKLGFDIAHLYGLTESYGPATMNDPGDDGDIDARAALMARQGRRHMTAGRARVVNEAGRDVVADGDTIGEIVLAGNTVMAGYFRDPEATEQAFRGGVFHTGDLAVMHPDGQIEIRDRKKDIIISGGENVSSLEVEKALYQHPEIRLAAVVAAPHPKWGETPWAFVELVQGSSLTADDLDQFCRQKLAGFKRPRNFVFGPLPQTATGKIQKFLLRQEAARIAAERVAQ